MSENITKNKLAEIFNEDKLRVLKYDVNKWNIEDEIPSWPLVYLIMNENDIYIGETKDFNKRFKQHKANKRVENPKNVVVAVHGFGNKSMVDYVESELIRLTFLDDGKSMLNLTKPKTPFSYKEDFFTKEESINSIKEIWNELKKLGVAGTDYDTVSKRQLSDLAPVINFDDKQLEIINSIVDDYKLGIPTIVNGPAGTGKSALIIRAAIELVIKYPNIVVGIYTAKGKNAISAYEGAISKMSDSLRKRIKVIDGFTKEKIHKKKRSIDYVLIDEAQLLRIGEQGGAYNTPHYLQGKYDNSKKNELEQIREQLGESFSLFYDHRQITTASGMRFFREYKKEFKSQSCNIVELSKQYRIESNANVEDFFWKLLNNEKCSIDLSNDSYKIYITSNIQEAENKLKEISNFKKEHPLSSELKSRFIASISEGKWFEFDEEKEKQMEIENLFTTRDDSYIWNTKKNSNTFEIESAPTEVGSIYTLQGKSLDYTAFIIGEDVEINGKEITYNTKNYVKYRSASHIFRLLTDEEKKEMVRNINYVLMTRAKKGLVLCIRDRELREFISKKIKNY